MDNDNVVRFRAPDELRNWLVDRATRMLHPHSSTQARVELDLWRTCLATELGRLQLTLAEARCLADVAGGEQISAAISTGGVPRLYAEAADAFASARQVASHPTIADSTYGAKWGVDEDQLLTWLRKLTPTQDAALRDALSRWSAGDGDPTVEGFAAVGLAAVDVPAAELVR